MVEPLAGVFGAFAVVLAEPILPYALAFAAGAMVYVVMDDIIPEAQIRWRACPDFPPLPQPRLRLPPSQSPSPPFFFLYLFPRSLCPCPTVVPVIPLLAKSWTEESGGLKMQAITINVC